MRRTLKSRVASFSVKCGTAPSTRAATFVNLTDSSCVFSRSVHPYLHGEHDFLFHLTFDFFFTWNQFWFIRNVKNVDLTISASQILREINFGECLKWPFLTIWRNLHFIFVHISQKCWEEISLYQFSFTWILRESKIWLYLWLKMYHFWQI